MKCPACGHEVTENFCENCGTPSPALKGKGVPFQQFSRPADSNVYRPPSPVRVFLVVAVLLLLLAGGAIVLFSIAETADQAPAGALQGDGWYGEGSYRVGKDLEPGVYYVAAEGNWASAEIQGSFFDDSRYEHYETFGYLELEKDDRLELEGGRMIQADSAPFPEPSQGWYGPGMYRIGRDLPAEEFFFQALEPDLGVSVISYKELSEDRETIAYLSSDTHCFYTPGDGLYLEVLWGRFTSAANAPSPEPVDGWYAEGMYRVGSQVPPGEYYVRASQDRSVFVEFLADSRDTEESYLDGQYFDNFGYFLLEEAVYLSVSGGSFTQAQNAPVPQAEDGVYLAGMYLVGRDLPAGTYLLTAEEDYSALYEIYTSPRDSYEDLVDSAWTDDETFFDVEEGQYLKVSYGSFRAVP